MSNVNDTPPNDAWVTNPFLIWQAQVAGIGTKPLGTFAIGDTEELSGLWEKTQL